MHSLAPLLDSIDIPDTTHGAYADDSRAIGKLKALLIWRKQLVNETSAKHWIPSKATEKLWLILKPERIELAKVMFAETKINITSEGRKHLGAAIGSSSYKKSYMKTKVDEWVSQLKILSEIAKSPTRCMCLYC